MLSLFKDQTQNIGIMPRIQVKLYRNGRYVPFTSLGFDVTYLSSRCRVNSGAQPLATQGPRLTATAISDAIQDWDDETESEFSDGRDIEEGDE
jgi:hypothetical protein